MKRPVSMIAKAALTLLLFWWIAASLNLQALSSSFGRLEGRSVIVATLLIAVQALLVAWRWHRIVVLLGGRLPAGRAIHLVFIGLFFNQALPSSVGGDAVRIWYLHRDGTAPSAAFASVAIERSTGLAMLGLLISMFTPAIWGDIQSPALRISLIAVGPCLLAGLGLVALADRFLPRRTPARIAAPLGHLACGLRLLVARPAAGAEILALGLVGSTLGLAAAYVLGRSLGLPQGLPTYIVLVGAAALFSVLPISLGGWGVREVGMVALFGTVGVASESALVLSITWGLLPLIVSLPGGLAWWADQSPARNTARGALPAKMASADAQATNLESKPLDS